MLQCIQVTDAPAAIVRPSENVRVITLAGTLNQQPTTSTKNYSTRERAPLNQHPLVNTSKPAPLKQHPTTNTPQLAALDKHP
jgi:hypothetical protein